MVPDDVAGEQVGLAEEVRDERRARQFVELLRRAELLDPALVHDRDGVGHGHGLLLVVGHVQEGQPDLVLDRLQLQLHLAAQLEVERAERLIEQQQGRPVDDGPGEGDPLLLTAGELLRLARREVVQLDQPQRLVSLAHRVADPAPAQPERHVLEHGHVREQRVALEDRVDRPLVRLEVRHILAADEDAALGGLLEPGDQPQRRRLAAAGGAEQREERSGRNGQVELFDGGEAWKALRDPDQLEVCPALGEGPGCHGSGPEQDGLELRAVLLLLGAA